MKKVQKKVAKALTRVKPREFMDDHELIEWVRELNDRTKARLDRLEARIATELRQGGE